MEMEELREPVIALDGKNIAFTAGGIKSEVWVMENFWPKEKVAAKYVLRTRVGDKDRVCSDSVNTIASLQSRHGRNPNR